MIATLACGTLRTLVAPRTNPESPIRLNSHRIREMFGSYVVDVLQQTNAHRIASLCSIHGDRHICRTLAVTLFMHPTPKALQAADQVIRAGASIGETLQSMGVQTEKVDDHWCSWHSGAHFAALTGDVSVGTEVAVRLYTLRTHSDTGPHDYAVIAEAYHPEQIAVSDSMAACHSANEPVGKHREALMWLRSALTDSVALLSQSDAQQG